MNLKIHDLLDRIQRMEDEVELEVQCRGAELHADFEQRRIRFEHEVMEQQRRFKMGILKYLAEARLSNVITAPIIYAVFSIAADGYCGHALPDDLLSALWHCVCAPARFPDIRPTQLSYLNLIEKINWPIVPMLTGWPRMWSKSLAAPNSIGVQSGMRDTC